MAYTRVNENINATVYEYRGLSTDTKPTSCPVGSTFYCVDTRKMYMWSGTAWVFAFELPEEEA